VGLQKGQDPVFANQLEPKFHELEEALRSASLLLWFGLVSLDSTLRVGSVSGAIFKERQWGPGPITRALAQLAHHVRWQERLRTFVPILSQVVPNLPQVCQLSHRDNSDPFLCDRF
jgi:hypothetical protein